MPNKKTVPMWKVNNVLFHYSDYVRAEAQGNPVEVLATFDQDYFIGTWQFIETALQVVEVN